MSTIETNIHPFLHIQDFENYSDYEACIELPPLHGQERSIVVRLTLDTNTNQAYPTLTYEVDGSHVELSQHAPVFDGDLFREIVTA